MAAMELGVRRTERKKMNPCAPMTANWNDSLQEGEEDDEAKTMPHFDLLGEL